MTAQPAREALPSESALVHVGMHQGFFRVGGHAHRAVFPAHRPGPHSGARFASVSLKSTPSRNGRASCVPGGSSTAICISLTVEYEIPPVLRPGDVHPTLCAVNGVQVQLVEHQRAVVLARVETPGATKRNCCLMTCMPPGKIFGYRGRNRGPLSKPVEARNSRRSQTVISWQCFRYGLRQDPRSRNSGE